MIHLAHERLMNPIMTTIDFYEPNANGTFRCEHSQRDLFGSARLPCLNLNIPFREANSLKPS